MKVVYNAGYGGFGISEEAANWMAERGHAVAVRLCEYNNADKGDVWYSHGFKCDRHDPLLVECVETLGTAANDACATLKIYTLKHGNRYMIDEYDGLERVIEPEDIKWNVVDSKSQRGTKRLVPPSVY